MIETKTQIIARTNSEFHTILKISAQMLEITLSDLIELGMENFITTDDQSQGSMISSGYALHGDTQCIARIDPVTKRMAQHTAIDLGCSMQDIVLGGSWNYIGMNADQIRSGLAEVHNTVLAL